MNFYVQTTIYKNVDEQRCQPMGRNFRPAFAKKRCRNEKKRCNFQHFCMTSADFNAIFLAAHFLSSTLFICADVIFFFFSQLATLHGYVWHTNRPQSSHP
jgi:hypothetical protein